MRDVKGFLVTQQSVSFPKSKLLLMRWKGRMPKTNYEGSSETSRRSWYIKLPWLGLTARLDPVWQAGEPQSKAIHVWGAGSIGWGSSQDLILFLCKCRIEDLKLSGLEDINDWTIIHSLAEIQTYRPGPQLPSLHLRGTSEHLTSCLRQRQMQGEGPECLYMSLCLSLSAALMHFLLALSHVS